jgi:hypothetical protein
MRRFAPLLFLLAGCPTESTPDAAMRDGGARDARGNTGDAFSLVDAGAAIDASAVVDAYTPDAPSEARIPIIVAAGSNHGRWLSIDEGMTWCSVRDVAPGTTDFDNPNLLRNITFTNGRFVTGSWTALFVSTNGYTWTDVTGDGAPAMGQWIAQVDYGNGWWVATGGYGTAMRSRDLTTWENVSDALPGNEASRTLAFGDGLFVTGRDSVGWWQSTDGSAWTQRDATAGSEVIFEGGSFRARPDYDRGRGIRLQSGWPNKIRRAMDADGASYVEVATLDESPTHFAFGDAPAADYASGVLPPALATCLGR